MSEANPFDPKHFDPEAASPQRRTMVERIAAESRVPADDAPRQLAAEAQLGLARAFLGARL